MSIRLLEVCRKAGLALGYLDSDTFDDFTKWYVAPELCGEPFEDRNTHLWYSDREKREFFPEGTTRLDVLRRAFGDKAEAVEQLMQETEEWEAQFRRENTVKLFFRHLHCMSDEELLAEPLEEKILKALPGLEYFYDHDLEHLLYHLWNRGMIVDLETGIITRDCRRRVVVVGIREDEEDSHWFGKEPEFDAFCREHEISISISAFVPLEPEYFRNCRNGGYADYLYVFSAEIADQIPEFPGRSFSGWLSE